MTVSATRAPEARSAVPFTIEVIAGTAFSDGISLTADDVLRGSADFSLFRRNDSMTANPTPPKGCRCADSGRAGQAVRSCCSTACRSTTLSGDGSPGASSRWIRSPERRSCPAADPPPGATMPWPGSSSFFPPSRCPGRGTPSFAGEALTREAPTWQSPKPSVPALLSCAAAHLQPTARSSSHPRAGAPSTYPRPAGTPPHPVPGAARSATASPSWPHSGVSTNGGTTALPTSKTARARFSDLLC